MGVREGLTTGSVAYNTFAKGLITDSSNFNGAPDSLKDISNFRITTKGTAEKRLGLKLEKVIGNSWDIDSNNTFLQTSVSERLAVPTVPRGHDKSFIAERMVTYDGRSYLILSNYYYGNNIYIYSEEEGRVVFRWKILERSGTPLSVAVNDRFIVATTTLLHKVVISYKNGEFTAEDIEDIEVRDFDGLDDNLSVETRPSNLSDEHKYNLENQGWGNTFEYSVAYIETDDEGDSSIRYRTVSGKDYESFKNSIGKYPSNADIASVGIYQDPNSGGRKVFKPENITKTYFGSGRAPMGSKVLKISEASPRRLDDGKVVLDQPSFPFGHYQSKLSVAFFAGRVWYTVGNNVMFSQVLGQDTSKFTKCYQEADPTAEEISDIVDTDGGLIKVSGASNIFKAVEFSNMLLLFADNGIWAITGDTVFTATSYSVNRVSSYTAVSQNAIKQVGSSVVFVSKSGIYAITQSEVTMQAIPVSLSLGSIQELFNSYPEESVSKAALEYLDKDNSLAISIGKDILFFDFTIKAWYRYTIPFECLGMYYSQGSYTVNVTQNVTSNGDQVQYNGEDVTVSQDTTAYITPQLRLIHEVGSNYGLYSFSDSSFVDFKGTEVEAPYTAYLVTYPLNLDNLDSKRIIRQFTGLFTKTETGYVENSEGGLEYIGASKCSLQVGWDMPTSGSYSTDSRNKWSRSYEIYRLSRYEAKSIGDIPGEALESLMTRTSIRGIGRTITFRLESSSGYDCRILGWNLTLSQTVRSK